MISIFYDFETVEMNAHAEIATEEWAFNSQLIYSESQQIRS